MKDNTYINTVLYTIYKFQNKNPYYLTIPKTEQDEYELYVSFRQEKTSKAKIKELNDILVRTNNKAIHLICNIKKTDIDEFSTYNDNKVALYKLLQKRIYRQLAKTYDYLKDKNIKVKIPVFFIKQNNNDTKLINWLEIDDHKLIKGLKYEKIRKAYNELIFSGTMVIPFLNNKENRNTEIITKTYTKYYILLTIIIALIVGIGIANLLIK